MGHDDINNPTHVWNRYFIHLFVAEMFLQVGLYSTRPLIANFAIFMGAAIATAATISGLAFVIALCLRPVSGYLSDRIDKKMCLLISSAFFLIGALGCAFAQSVEVVTFFVAIQGIAYSFKSISVTSLTALFVPKDRIGSGIGWIGLLNAISLAIGPMLGAFICDSMGYQAAFLFTAVLDAIGTALVVVLKSPDKNVKERRAAAKLAPKEGSLASRLFNSMLYVPALPIAAITVTAVISNGTMSSLVLTAEEMGYLEGGSVFFLAFSILALVSRPLSGRLYDQFGLLPVFLPSTVLCAIGIGSLAFFRSVEAVVFCGVMMGIGQSSAQCTLQAEAVRGVSEEMLGRATNTYYFGPDIAVGFGPVLSGAILQEFGGSAMFMANAIITLSGIALVLMWYARAKRGVIQAPSA